MTSAPAFTLHTWCPVDRSTPYTLPADDATYATPFTTIGADTSLPSPANVQAGDPEAAALAVSVPSCTSSIFDPLIAGGGSAEGSPEYVPSWDPDAASST